MLCLSGFELYSRWVPLIIVTKIIPVKDATCAVAKESLKKFRLVRDSNPALYDTGVAL